MFVTNDHYTFPLNSSESLQLKAIPYEADITGVRIGGDSRTNFLPLSRYRRTVLQA